MTQRDAMEASLIAAVPNLRAFANSLCGDPTRADDLVQDTLVKAWANVARFEEGSNLRAWLFTILRNTYFSELRKRRREVEDCDGAIADRVPVPPEQQAHMDLIDFKKAFASLSDEQKEVLLLVAAEGFSYEEAAEITGAAVGTVKSRVNRGRVALIKALGFEAEETLDPNAEFAGLVGIGRPNIRG